MASKHGCIWSAVGMMFAASPSLSAEVRWHESMSPNYIVKHESAFMPPGLMLELGKMHNRLRRDLSSFSPWMAKERINIYLYATQQTYVRGEFQPPGWSNGVAFYQRKLIALHEQPEDKKLLSILAHEMTHLLFESYFAEENQRPPTWLNEGLAMMEEASDPKAPEKADWHQAMWILNEKGTIPLDDFFKISPTTDLAASGQDEVSLWYVQAYSIVYFLYREHTQLQFRNFCAMLRGGKPLEQSLWKAYRIGSLAKFETQWRKWLKLPVARENVLSRPQEAPSARTSPPKKPLSHVGFDSFNRQRFVGE